MVIIKKVRYDWMWQILRSWTLCPFDMLNDDVSAVKGHLGLPNREMGIFIIYQR